MFDLFSAVAASLDTEASYIEATVGVVIGTIVGSRLLREVPDRWFRPIVAVVLLLLGLSMLLRGFRV